MMKSIHRVVIDQVAFDLGSGILEYLILHEIDAVEVMGCAHANKCSTDFLVLSSQRAAELGVNRVSSSLRNL